MNIVQIEFDPDKDVINQAKHGISLAEAASIQIDAATVLADTRAEYGELRFIAYAPIDGRLHAVWYTWRDGIMRVIGLRKANDRERRRYERSA